MNTDHFVRFLELTDQKKELDNQIKEINKKLEHLKDHILREFEKASLSSVRCQGRTIYLMRKLWAKPKKGDYAAACQALRTCGLNDVIKETFNLNTISAYVREWDANGEPIPEPIAQAFDIVEVFTIQSRKGA